MNGIITCEGITFHFYTKQKWGHGDPHYLAFYTVLRDVVKYASVLPEPSVAVICDDDAA